MKACFVSLVALVLAQNTNAQTAKECSSGAQLAVSMSVNTDQPKDKEDKYRAKFVLTVKNRGSSTCNLTQPVSKLWKVEVYRQDPAENKLHAVDTSQDEWTWMPSAQGQQDPSLDPGAEKSAIAEWKTVATKETTTYVVGATFGPTKEVTATRFVLPPREMKINLLITGQLMGYYRVPNRQTLEHRNCEGDPSLDASVFFSRFGRSTQFGQSPVNEIRLGMGDNFAPNYYSRSFDMSEETDHPDPAKYYYSWDTNQSKWRPISELPDNAADIQNGHGTIAMDNVACFFLQAHYDAIVPAKHDIYYGPDRLRGLARLLANPTEMELVGLGFVPRYHAVQMLATNMVIKTTWANGHEPKPDSTKHHLLFATEYTAAESGACPKCSFEVTSFSDSGFVFPWMQLVHVTANGRTDQFDQKSAPRLFLCKAIGPDDSPGDPDSFMEASGSEFCNKAMRLDFVSDKFEKPASDQKKDSSNKAAGAEPHELVYRIPTKSDLLQRKPSILAPGHNYAICVVDSSLNLIQDQPKSEDSLLARTSNQKKDQHTNKPRPYCVRFSVYIPFLQYPDWPEERYDRGPVHYKNPSLYVLKNDREEDVKSGRTPVVIFGIVDPELLADVGADNSSWQTVKGDSTSGGWKKDYDTRTAIVDPVETLNQLEDYFETVYEQTHKDSFRGLRVLMAEMSPGRAKQLAERLPKRLRFDVILSAADDQQATPNQELRVQPAIYLPCAPILDPCEKKEAETANGGVATPTSFLVVPPGHDQADVRQLQARELTIKTDGVSYWNYSLSGDPALVPVPGTSSLAEAKAEFWTAMCRSVPGADNDSAGKDSKDKNKNQECNGARDWDESKKTTIIQHLALWSIRKKYGADVALLQKRDFYIHGVEDYLSEHCRIWEKHGLQCSAPPEPLDIQEILDRVVWKGDVVKTRSVQGSVLKKVLEESGQFEEREKQIYLYISDAGRPLVMLGIRKDPEDSNNYLINSKPLDPKAIYTVATSDYIALGDTGYPELAKPPTGDLDRPALPVGGIYRIAGLACKEVRPVQNNCEERISAKDYFDRIANRQPDDPGPGNTSLHKFYAWTFLRPHLGQPVKKEADPTVPLEKRVNWEWSVEQLSIGFSGLSHTDTTEKLSQEFGGVLNSQVNANHSHSWDWDANSKIAFYHPKADWFVEETLQYSSSFIAQIDAPRSETQSRNLLAFDGGTYFHLYPSRGKELPQFSLVLSGHFDTQVAGVLTNLAVNTALVSAGPATLTFNQGRTMFIAARPGLRWQNRESYIEAGLQGGSTLNTIKQFDITTAPGGPTVSCTLQDSVSLTNCINAFSQNNPNTPVTTSSNIRVERRPIDRYGAYWKIKMSVPINPVVSYSFRDRSEYYFLSSGDNLLNTRFLHELVNTVKFMVLPNLSFEPTYTIFLYENKLDYNFLLQQQYSVKINYSFSLSNLHESKRQFRYAKGSSE